MTDMVVYHNSNGATVSMPCKVKEWFDFHNKDAVNKGNKTSTVRDHNKVTRMFSWVTLLSRANKDTLKGYLQPTAAPTYDATYPKIVITWDGATTENVIGMIVGCEIVCVGDDKFQHSITFRERFS